ncbi:stage II sporulation protein P [Longirhabdus pacifica]|uniref:stage II sporulation protein P n=1 Tax=Longirhabdus pacifica TaxID=2305227 RepID=UPI0010089FA0|nr:stage II sporulation protein P [Longirhabdus pacifica]
MKVGHNRNSMHHVTKTEMYSAVVKPFAIMAMGTLLLFFILSSASLLQGDKNVSLKGFNASAISSEFFFDMLSMEMHGMRDGEKEYFTFSAENMMDYVVHRVTNISFEQPETFLSKEMSGFYQYVTNSDTSLQLAHSPPPSNQEGGMINDVIPEEEVVQDNIIEEENLVFKEEEQEQLGTTTALMDTTRVFIYHSHNRESWLPELPDEEDANNAFHDTINITLLGDRLAEQLKAFQVGAVSSAKDYKTTVQGYNWNYSYKYSLQTVKEASAVYPDLQYYIDIHRDAQNREKTTVNMNGLDYAQVYFVIGHRNPDWKLNMAFAQEIHDKLESAYPGLSRGILSKDVNQGHAEYNQSFSPNSILVEIGGVENTLQESNRTVDVLASVLADIIYKDMKVNKPMMSPEGEI